MRRAAILGTALVICLMGTTIAASGAGAAGRVSDQPAATSAVAYQEDPAHDGHSTDPNFGPPLKELWHVGLGGSVSYPLIVGNTVYAAVLDAHLGDVVEALALSSGKVRWEVSVSQLGAIAYDGGRVFAVTGGGTLIAMDATSGAIDWSEQLPGQYSFSSAPTAVDGTVYVGGAGVGGTLYAVDEATGSVRWTAEVENGDNSSPAVDSSGIYVAYACEQAYSFGFSGTLRWHSAGPCEGGGGATVVLHGGRDYVRDYPTGTPETLSEANGEQVSAFSSVTPPAFDGSLLFAVGNGTVTASNARTGTVVWHNSAWKWNQPPLTVGGYVVVGVGEKLALLDEHTGAIAWSGNTDNPVSNGFAEAQGELLVPEGGVLAAYQGLDEPRAQITSGPLSGSYVGSTATFGFTSNDDEATYACTLDRVTVGCHSPFTVKNLSTGAHTFTVRVAGVPGVRARRSFTADTTDPALTLDPIRPAFRPSPTAVVRWSATDAGSGVASFDVRTRIAGDRGHVGAWQHPAGLTGTTQTRTTLDVPAGKTLCVSVRSNDEVSNRSAWSPAQCSTGYTDDRALSASNGWVRGSASENFDGTFTGTRRRGATLRLAGIEGGRVAVVARVCPDCGSVEVVFGTMHKVLSLQSRSVSGNRVFTPAGAPSDVRGTLVLRVRSSGRPVRVDAVGVERR